MFPVLFQKYPYYYGQERLIRITFWLCVFVFLFLYFFQPFRVEFSEHNFSYPLICAIQSTSASIMFLLCVSIFNMVYRPDQKEDSWTVIKEILFCAVILLFIGIGNFLIRNIIYDNPNNLSLTYLEEELLHTFLIGTLVFSGLTFANFYRLSDMHQKAANSFSSSLKPSEPSEIKIAIKTASETENFTLNLNQFLFARAEGNYVEFYIKDHDGCKRLLKRITLTAVANQLQEVPYITRTHRTYIVNAHHIKTIKGNAQGYQLAFDGTSETVPVSRYQIDTFNKVMNSI